MFSFSKSGESNAAINLNAKEATVAKYKAGSTKSKKSIKAKRGIYCLATGTGSTHQAAANAARSALYRSGCYLYNTSISYRYRGPFGGKWICEAIIYK